MVEKHLVERVVRLETQMESQVAATKELIASIKELTNVLNRGRGAFWMLCVLSGVVSTISAVVAYFITKLTILH